MVNLKKALPSGWPELFNKENQLFQKVRNNWFFSVHSGIKAPIVSVFFGLEEEKHEP